MPHKGEPDQRPISHSHSSPPDGQRWQIGLKSLLLFILLSALALSAWRQWSQRREVAAWRARAQLFEREVELRRGVADVARKLDLKDPEQRRVMQLLTTMDSRLGDTLVRQRIANPGDARELFLFHHDAIHCEGAIESVALLMAAERMVDYVIHNESDWHEARIESDGPDGKLAIVYHCRKGSYDDKRIYTERYAISADGLERVDPTVGGAALGVTGSAAALGNLDPQGKGAQTTGGRSLRGREALRPPSPRGSP